MRVDLVSLGREIEGESMENRRRKKTTERVFPKKERLFASGASPFCRKPATRAGQSSSSASICCLSEWFVRITIGYFSALPGRRIFWFYRFNLFTAPLICIYGEIRAGRGFSPRAQRESMEF